MTMPPTNRNIPASIHGHRETQLLPVPGIQDESEQVLPFSHYLWLLRKHGLKIGLTVAVCTGLAAFVSFCLTPVYESTARIAIDLKTPSTIIGGSSSAGGTSGGEADQIFNTELQLIQSDTVLRPVADQFHLINLKGPRRMPAGVKIADAVVALENLSVVHPINSFLINISYRSPDSSRAAAIANAVAHSYILRGMEMRTHSSIEESAFIEKQIADLKKNMDDSAISLAGYEKELGVTGDDKATSILTARLLQLNTQYTDAQNDRIRKEADYRAYRTGALAAIQVSPQASALAKMEETVHAAQGKMAIAKTIYGPNYAEYRRAANELNEVTSQYNIMQAEIGSRIKVEFQEASNRENMLRASLLQAKSESDALNAHSMQYQELKRQAEANKSLYTELFRKVKEAGINGAFQGSSIRIADEARPQLRPVFPNKVVFVTLGFFFSFLISALGIIIRDMFDKSLRDPEQTRRAIGVEVLGILPYLRQFQSLSPTHSPRGESSTEILKASTNWFGTADFYEEAVYTLLSSIIFGFRGAPLRSILVTSAVSGEGKSSCVAHMAAAYARQGYRTLLIDADLRRPSQQRRFGLSDHQGLAEAIAKNRPFREIRQPVSGNEKLDVITAGTPGPRAFDQIGKKVQEILGEAQNEYDMIFIDAPPMLYFAEPIQLACVADGVLVVSHAGQTSGQAVSSVLATLRRLGATTLGVVLNQVQHDMSFSYQGYNSYYQRIQSKTLSLPGEV